VNPAGRIMAGKAATQSGEAVMEVAVLTVKQVKAADMVVPVATQLAAAGMEVTVETGELVPAVVVAEMAATP